MPPQFTKSEWYTEVDETEGITLPDAPIITVNVHDEDETNEFHYKVPILHVLLLICPFELTYAFFYGDLADPEVLNIFKN